jgi:hypothetical protein
LESASFFSKGALALERIHDAGLQVDD